MQNFHINLLRTFDFNIRSYYDGHFFKVNVNLKYPSEFIRMEDID
jgi:hypothetical protein